MAELWTPQARELPDVANIYDMMMLFQDQLAVIEFEGGGKEQWFPVAAWGIVALARQLKGLSEDDRQVRVETNLTWMQSTDDPRINMPVKGCGIIGSFVDVHGVSHGDSVPKISMAMEVESMYMLDEPDNVWPALTPSVTPITDVRAIESAAA